MIAHASVNILDNFTDRTVALVDGFLANMPSLTTCEAHIPASWNGFHNEGCGRKPVVSDIETQFDYCAECWRRFGRGDWSGQ